MEVVLRLLEDAARAGSRESDDDDDDDFFQGGSGGWPLRPPPSAPIAAECAPGLAARQQLARRRRRALSRPRPALPADLPDRPTRSPLLRTAGGRTFEEVLAAAKRELQPVYAAALERAYAAQQQEQQEEQPAYAYASAADVYAAELADAAAYGASYGGQQHAYVAAAASVQPEEPAAAATDASGYDDIYGMGQQAHYNSPAYEQLFAAGEPFDAAPVASTASLYGQEQQEQQQGYAAGSFASEGYAADSYQQHAGGSGAAPEQQAFAHAPEPLLQLQQEEEAAAGYAAAAAAAIEPEYQAIAARQRTAVPALARALVSVRRTARLLRSKGLDAVNLNRHLDALQQEYQAAGQGAAAAAGRWQRKRQESALAAVERQRSLTDVRYELQVCVHMCQHLGDPSHPDLLMAAKRLAAAAGILATLPSVLPSFGV
jgi:hypothetical protein